jgi:hypothetical protein
MVVVMPFRMLTSSGSVPGAFDRERQVVLDDRVERRLLELWLAGQGDEGGADGGVNHACDSSTTPAVVVGTRTRRTGTPGFRKPITAAGRRR